MATSALRNSTAPEVLSPLDSATPTLRETKISPLGRTIGSAMALTSRSATSERLLLVVVLAAQHRELVAAEPRQGVACPHNSSQAVGNGAQDLVAYVVAQTVVDEFESIDVEEHDGHPASISRTARRSDSLEAVHEELPVGERGERIMDGRLGEPLA